MDLGVELEPAPHVGVASCKNVGAVFAHMLSAGHSPGAPERVAAFQPEPAEGEGDEGASEASVDVEERIVKLQGLPYSASAADVASFMHGLDIVPAGVTMCINHLGQP